MAFYFSGHPNFAANQSVTVMEIITFESKAYKELDNKITAIADYIFNHMETARQSEEDMWVDSYEVCTFLKISEKTKNGRAAKRNKPYRKRIYPFKMQENERKIHIPAFYMK